MISNEVRRHWVKYLDAAIKINQRIGSGHVFVNYAAHIDNLILDIYENGWSVEADEIRVWINGFNPELLKTMRQVAEGKLPFAELVEYAKKKDVDVTFF